MYYTSMAMRQHVLVREHLSRVLLDLIYLFLSFAVSLNLLRLLRLAVPHSYGIENLSNFRPESSYPVLLGVVAATAGLFLVLKKLESVHSNYLRLAVAAILVGTYLIGATAPYFASYEGNIDTFHHGEQLAPAVAFDQGAKPYKDLFFLHGAGEDVIVPWLAFQLFGESIGSYYFMIGMLQLLTVSIFLFLIHKLFRSNLAYLVVALWFFLGTYAAFYYVRDIPVWIAIGLIYVIITNVRPRPYLLAGLGLASSLALFHSFDRGAFLTAICGVVLVGLVFFVRSESGYTFKIDGYLQRLKSVLPGIAGYLCGLLLGAIVLGVSGFSAFITMTLQAARYQGAIFNYPYPGLSPATAFEWLPVLLLIVLLLTLGRDAYRVRRALPPLLMFEIILFILGVLFFRAATGRPDLGHVAYGSVILLLLLFFVAFRRLHGLWGNKPAQFWPLFSLYAPVLLVTALIFNPGIVKYYRLAEMHQTPLISTRVFLKAPSKPDSFWTNDRMEQVTKRLQQQAGKGGSLFVFPSEPLFYYTTGLPNPTRYSITWFADAQPLEDELLKDLKSNPPTVVVYEAGAGFNDMPDYITIKQRLPKVDAWLLSEYPQREQLHGVTILTKE